MDLNAVINRSRNTPDKRANRDVYKDDVGQYDLSLLEPDSEPEKSFDGYLANSKPRRFGDETKTSTNCCAPITIFAQK
jgi:hypothetical protein